MVKHRYPLTEARVLIAVICAATSLLADPPESADEATEAAKIRKHWLDVCTNHAIDYRMFPAGKPNNAFERVQKPIFSHVQRHSEANRTAQIGLVFLWVEDNGHPAVVGTVIANPMRPTERPHHRRMSHVLQSMSTAPLTAIWREKSLWTPTKPGVEWQPVPDAPIPGKSAAERLRQARGIARTFKSHSIDRRGGRWELRLLPKPLYDYELQPTDSGLGGALFVFCEGTDPEVLLTLETRQTEDGPRWQFAFAAFSNYELHGSLAGKEVWSVPKRGHPPKTSPRWAIHGIEILPEPSP